MKQSLTSINTFKGTYKYTLHHELAISLVQNCTIHTWCDCVLLTGVPVAMHCIMN